MKHDPRLGVLKANLFVRLLHSKDATSAELVYALPVRARSFFRSFARFSCRFILHFHVSLVVDCSKKCLAGVAVWRSVLLRPCLSTFFSDGGCIVLEKVTFSDMRSNSES